MRFFHFLLVGCHNKFYDVEYIDLFINISSGRRWARQCSELSCKLLNNFASALSDDSPKVCVMFVNSRHFASLRTTSKLLISDLLSEPGFSGSP